MNIQKLEAVLEEMRLATSAGAGCPAEQVRNWAERIGGAVTELLMAGLGTAATSQPISSAVTTSELGIEPGGHDWDQRGT